MRRPLPLLLLLAACSSDFQPANVVDKLRILGVKADPPDLRPGEAAALPALVVDPSAPERRNTTVLLACDPDPQNLQENPCTRYQNLQDPSQVVQGGGDGGAAVGVPGARFIGLGGFARYTAPADLFSALPPDALPRRRGALAVILALAVGEEVPIPPSPEQLQAVLGRVQRKETPSVLAIKRIRIAESELNQEPVLGAVTTADLLLAPDLALRVRAGETVTLRGAAARNADEAYTAWGPDGTAEARAERAIFSWFTSAGSFDRNRSVEDDPEQRLTAPDGGAQDPAPADGRFQLWVVLRDGRGGTDWASYPGFVCDPGRPAPSFASAALDDPGDPRRVRIRGAHLDQVLDVQLAGLPLPGRYDAAHDDWLGELPAGAHGDLPLLLRGTNCSDVTGSLSAP